MATSLSPSDTSVTTSLAELARLEGERVREEARRAEHQRREAERRAREIEGARRQAEQARTAAEQAASEGRERACALERQRIEAREQAAVEVARIQAEAKVRLEADGAARAHEIAVLKARMEGVRSRRVYALAVALALSVAGGCVAVYWASRSVVRLEAEGARLRAGQLASVREREIRNAVELGVLDRRYAALRAGPIARGAEQALAVAEATRSAIVGVTPRDAELGAFHDAVDDLEVVLSALQTLEALDGRYADLCAWEHDQGSHGEPAAFHDASAARARAAGSGPASLRAYAAALDRLRDVLVAATSSPRGAQATTPHVTPERVCRDGDPLCSPDGKTM